MTLVEYSGKHKTWTACVLLFLLFVAFFCCKSLYALIFEGSKAVLYALIAGMVGFAATASGSLPGFFLNKLTSRTEDVMLGISAGMMLAAAIFSLLLPSVEVSEKLFNNNEIYAMALVVSGIAIGVILLLLVNSMIPHEHIVSGQQGPQVKEVTGIWLFVFAIIIHNFPEGMALGVSFAAEDVSIGLPFTTAIALQDMPEGLAVVLALRAAGVSNTKAVTVGVLSGVMDPIGALLGVGLTSQLGFAYPLGLALSAGAMLFIVSHEVIPETHRNGHQLPATIGLMAGFCLMMVLEKVLA